jgi:hypothetical protein
VRCWPLSKLQTSRMLKNYIDGLKFRRPVHVGQQEGNSAECSNRPSSKAVASEEVRRTLRYVEPLSDARTMLADRFSILLKFSCQPIDHHAGHFRHSFLGVLQRNIDRQDIKQVNVVPVLSRQVL